MMYFMHVGRNQEIGKGMIKPAGRADIGMRESCRQHHQGLVDHDAVHGRSRKNQQQEKCREEGYRRDDAGARWFTSTWVSLVVNQVKTPEQADLYHPMHQPAAEIERQYSDQH